MNYFPRIRSKNHSLNALRKSHRGLPALPVRSVVRFGSITETRDIFRKPSVIPIIEINTVEAVKNSSSKIKMKEAFDKAGVNHPEWFLPFNNTNVKTPEGEEVLVSELPYPIVAKRVFGSKGRGMHLIRTLGEFNNLREEINNNSYIFEEFKNYVREYRLHCTQDGCFYTCRKMLKEGAEDRWYRNDSNCVWYVEENPSFDKPVNWEEIIEQCICALQHVGLDFGAFDVRVQSSVDKDGLKRDHCNFVIIEVNSAPSFGNITEQKYKEILPELILKKAKNAKNI